MVKGDALLSFSGGLDSTVLLSSLLREGRHVTCVSYKYGSHHNKLELKAAKTIYDYYSTLFPGKIEKMELDLSAVFNGMQCVFLLPDKPIPEGKYDGVNIAQTVVPARNLVFISAMAAIACSRGIPYVAVGVHANDSVVYPDCRPGFIKAVSKAVNEATEHKVSVLAPFVNKSKAYIVKVGAFQDVPFHLTRTCYTEHELACGKCGSCIDRLNAFKKAKIVDPVRYAHEV